MSDALLEVKGVSKRFGGFTALDGVSVAIRPGERFGLIGPNGSGKTTLINCVSGVAAQRRRLDRVRRRGHHAPAGLPAHAARHRAQLPDPAAVREHDGAREPDGAARVRRGRTAASAQAPTRAARRWRSSSSMGLADKADTPSSQLSPGRAAQAGAGARHGGAPAAADLGRGDGRAVVQRGRRGARDPVQAQRDRHHHHHDRAHHAGGDALLRARGLPRRRAHHLRGHAGRDRGRTPTCRRPTLALKLTIDGVDAGYGAVRALHGVSLEVSDRRDRGAARHQRQRQEHADEMRHGHGAARRRGTIDAGDRRRSATT